MASLPSSAHRPRVVVVGAGFGGLRATQELADCAADIVLIDQHNYHKFQPLLYQVATAGLEPDEIVYPVRDIFRRNKNVRFLLGCVREVDLAGRSLTLVDGLTVPYDYLILAAGATTNYFGVPGAKEYALPMKSVPEALHLRNHILGVLERAERESGRSGEGDSVFVVVGGGATGVETAGQLAELFQRVLRDDYRSIDTSRARVILLEMLPELMMPYAPPLRAYVREALEKRGIEVRTETTVERVLPDAVELKSGETIPTSTLIWAAGVRAGPLADAVGTEQDRTGRLITGPDLTIPGHSEVFVIGDMCGGHDENDRPYPQLATVAIQQGRYAAREIGRRLRGEPSQPFRYSDPGIMATIGRNAAIAQLPGGIQLKGFVAWLMWAFVHIYKLVGFRNRFDVFLNWVYNYVTYNFGARIIMDGVPQLAERGAAPGVRDGARSDSSAHDRERTATGDRTDGSAGRGQPSGATTDEAHGDAPESETRTETQGRARQ